MWFYTVPSARNVFTPFHEPATEFVEVCISARVRKRSAIQLIKPVLNTSELHFTSENRALCVHGESNGLPTFSLGFALDQESAAVVWPKVYSLYHSLSDITTFARCDWPAINEPHILPWCSILLFNTDLQYDQKGIEELSLAIGSTWSVVSYLQQ